MKPISVKEKLPNKGRVVLASFVNSRGHRRIICARYVERFTEESISESYDEYCEEKDAYYLYEGWYEVIENWDEFEAIYVAEGEVDYWMPMPKEMLEL